jgi:hypothetical protein
MPQFNSGEESLRRFAGAARMERMGRMNGWALRGVLALIDGETDVVDAVLSLMADFDDQPGRVPLPASYNRWEFATKQIERLADDWMALAEHVGITISYAALMNGTRATLSRLAPVDRRQAALDLLDRAVAADRDGRRANEPYSAEMLLYYMAMCAWVASNKKLFPAQHLVRLELISRIHKVEATAIGIPETERISDITDRDAIDFLAWMYDDQFAALIPLDPAERSLPDLDVIAAVKAHLLEVGGPEATTLAQKAALNKTFIRIFKSGLSDIAAAKAQPQAGRPAPMRRPPGKSSRGKKGKRQTGRATPKAAGPEAPRPGLDAEADLRYLRFLTADFGDQDPDPSPSVDAADEDQSLWRDSLWFSQLMTMWHCATEPDTWLHVAETVDSKKEHVNNTVTILSLSVQATILGLLHTLAVTQRRLDVAGLDFTALTDITSRRDPEEIIGILEATLADYPADTVPMSMAKSFAENMVKWNGPQGKDDERAFAAAVLELVDRVCQDNAALAAGPGPSLLAQRTDALEDWHTHRGPDPFPYKFPFDVGDDT